VISIHSQIAEKAVLLPDLRYLHVAPFYPLERAENKERTESDHCDAQDHERYREHERARIRNVVILRGRDQDSKE